MNGPQVFDLGKPTTAAAPTPQANPASAAVTRQLVLLLDGTNNTLTGRIKDTNVLRLYEHLAKRSDPAQILYYDPGVGCPDAMPSTGFFDRIGRWLQRMRGLVWGRGIYENICDGYLFLMRNWRPGDEIWIFGFSRGAFSARSISGMVHLFGILDSQHESMLPTLLRVYFSKAELNGQSAADENEEPVDGRQDHAPRQRGKHAKRSRGDVARQIRWAFCRRPRGKAWVHFVGVWDTVESVGMPAFGVQISSKPTIEKKRIAHVRHALALDELRLTFRPRLYNQPNGGTAKDRQSLHQVWFRGVHSDVGGGYCYDEAGLSNRAYDWMIQEAIQCNLRCAHAEPVAPACELHDTVHTVSWWALAGLTVRLPRWDAPRASVVEHWSVLGAPMPLSVWGRPWDRYTRISLVAAVACAAVGLALQVVALSDSLFAPDWARPALLALAQVALFHSPYSALSEIFSTKFVGNFGWAMIADTLVFLPAYAFLCGRLTGWAYRSAAGYRRARENEGRPVWHWLGLCPLLMAAGDLVENLLTLWVTSWSGSLNFFQASVQWLIGLASTIKWLGLGGSAALVLIALTMLKLKRRQSQAEEPTAPPNAIE